MISMGLSKWAAAGASLLCILLSGCATSGPPWGQYDSRHHGGAPTPPRSEITVWRLDDLVRFDQPMVLLRDSQGIHGAVEIGLVKRVLAIGEKMLQAAGEGPQPELVLLASGSINAFAFFNGNQPTIAFTLGMVRLLTEDDDAWAALLGHELAHLRLDHHRNMHARRERTETTSSFAGLLLSTIGLPFASLAVDATATLADRAFSRDDERQADSTGVDYMRRAGFAAEGAVRLQQLLLTTPSKNAIRFLSTHPGGEERIANLRKLMRGEN
ncbi:MAG: M48 family metallopeptidase [Sulfuritalea sp.]|nr:M48 family metallopeptidase [Sulfuritalea sp.]